MFKKRRKHNSKYVADKIHGDTTLVGIVEGYGYLIYSIKSSELQVIPNELIISLFDRFKFNNAVVINNNIACTTCNIEDLPKYITNSDRPNIRDLIPKSSNICYIITKLMGDAGCYAYRVATGDCHVLDLRDIDVIDYVKHGGIVVNASLSGDKLNIITD